jgi:ribosomal-protein-alanine N-acetyltransferase
MKELTYKTYTPFNKLTSIERKKAADFLYEQLGEYGDELVDIQHCIDYAMGEVTRQGGFVIISFDDLNIVGVVVVNETGMSGYIPENILVYIATHEAYRGRGIGKALVQNAIQQSKGGMALHVEPHNPAKFLYEKVGFTNKYLEMRYTPSDN